MKIFPLKPMLWAAGASLVMIAGGSLASSYSVTASVSIPVFMLITIVVAWRAGFRASLTVAIVATLGLDFFFTEPKYSLEVTSPRDVFALLTFAATSTLVSHLSNRVRVNSAHLALAEQQQRLLYEFSRSALLIDWKDAVEEQLCELLQTQFGFVGVAIRTNARNNSVVSGDVPDANARLDAAIRAQSNQDFLTHSESFRVLKFGTRATGVLLLRGSSEPLVADSLAALVATHLERIRSVQSEVRAQSQAVSERLRSAVLDGLAHAVKTPLTTIIAASSGLREIGPLTPVQSQLAETIEDQAQYLTEVTNKLLRTASLETREVRVQAQQILLADLFAGALGELHSSDDRARITLPDELNKSVSLDPELFKLIIVQLLENALKYSAAASVIQVELSWISVGIRVAIHNVGSYIPAGEHALVFERYYRGMATEHKASGTGIGLSAAKNAAEAMGGKIWLESSPQAGTTFFLSLPVEKA